MNIKETFLSLTTKTYPHGTEHGLFHLLPQDLEMDDFGNLYKQIGEKPSTMFACHLDTATSAITDVNHVFSGDSIKTDGTSILGADDKAGATILMHMMENKVPGLYYFFLGEEVGCIGSKKVADLHKTSPIEYIKKVVSFDRRGTTSIITHQCSARCCSDEFGTALATALNQCGLQVYDNDTVLAYKNDRTGLYTDSAQFTKIYPECTNISVGYQNEHTFSEVQNIKHLHKLAEAAILVDWESLPISRDPSKVEWDYSSYYGYGGYGEYGDDYGYGYQASSYKAKSYGSIGPKNTTSYSQPSGVDNTWFVDYQAESYVTCITIDKSTKKVTKVDLGPSRISDECDEIAQFLMSLDIAYDSFKWNVMNLTVNYSEEFYPKGHKTECDRNELSEYIPELDFWKECVRREEEKAEKFKEVLHD